VSRPAFLSDPALLAVLDALPRARIVGGAVRDHLAGRAVADIDLATPDRPEDVIRALKAAGLRAVPTGLSHGTVTAISSGRGFEVTTLRLDVETDGRHAVVAFTDDWLQDAERRDFTFNAMSMTRDGTIFDPFGGADDLRAGITRFVGDPAQRIREDYLRALRFFRFHARYGTRPPDPATEAALRGAVPHLAALSVERIWNELRRILAAPDPRGTLRLMAEYGVLAAALGMPFNLPRLEQLVALGAPADPLLRLAALLDGDAVAFSERLRLSHADADRLVALRTGTVPNPGASDADLRRALADASQALLIDRCWLADDGAPGWDDLRRRLSTMARPVFPFGGRDVVAMGIPPGPAVGQALAAVRAWWMEGGCVADAAACRAALGGVWGAVGAQGVPGGPDRGPQAGG